MAAGVVVGGVFLPCDELLRVEERSVRSRANLVHDGRFEIDKHCARNVLSGARLAEEGVERVIASPKCSVRGHQSVRLNPVLEAVQLPARVAHLTASLADVYGYNFTHFRSSYEGGFSKKSTKIKGRTDTQSVVTLLLLSPKMAENDLRSRYKADARVGGGCAKFCASVDYN